MGKHPPREHLPGNDGRWYLELVGVVEPPLESTDSYATLEGLVPPPAADDTATLAAGAAGATVNGTLVAEPDPGGAPISASSEGASRRWLWAVLVALVFAVAAAVAGAAYFLPREASREAAAASDDHRAALVAMRSELPNTQAALGDLTDPASNADAVSGVPVAVAELSSVSGRAVSVATAPLPETLPFVPRTGFDELASTRATMTILGASGRDLAGRLGIAFTYRTTIESLFGVHSLPVEAPDPAITDLSIALAADLAETGRLVADLPPDAVFTDVLELASASSQRYATWQLEYLDALHEGDDERAAALIAELDQTVEALRVALTASLADVRADLDPLIVELAAELETAIERVPG